jgi:hypothetical protein
MWVRFETYHDVTYFTPESRAATDALGCRGGWMGYFGMRAAPLGAAPPEVVTAVFYNFHPRMVARALPDAWRIASPEQFLDTRLAGVDGALRRLLGDVDGLAEAAELATEAANAAPSAGRVLAAANLAMKWPDEPHLKLWHACTVLRESRGDGHVAALVALGLGPCETLVLFGADNGLDPAYLRAARGWSEEEWATAEQALTDRGLLADAQPTKEGRALRQEIEDRTDAAAQAPWEALGNVRTERLDELLTPPARRIGGSNGAMRRNPMALDAVRELNSQ